MPSAGGGGRVLGGGAETEQTPSSSVVPVSRRGFRTLSTRLTVIEEKGASSQWEPNDCAALWAEGLVSCD